MTPADLYTLIQSDAQAKALFAAGNDTDCAVRCGVIAPPIRQRVPADRIQEISSLNGLWGTLQIAKLNTSLTDPPRGAAIAFIDWVEAGRALDMDNPAVQQMAATLVTFSLATAVQVAQLSEAGNTPQTFTAVDVGAARQEGAINGVT
jgi:hypothetical protein